MNLDIIATRDDLSIYSQIGCNARQSRYAPRSDR
jgi:hypothetical protein